jgi:hypothetical protein
MSLVQQLVQEDKNMNLILWGFHPAHGNIPLKLCDYSKAAEKQRQKEGWTTAAYKKGDEPTGLILQAKKTS